MFRKMLKVVLYYLFKNILYKGCKDLYFISSVDEFVFLKFFNLK